MPGDTTQDKDRNLEQASEAQKVRPENLDVTSPSFIGIDLDSTSPSLLSKDINDPMPQMTERTLVGEVIDNQFKIIEVLGKGGMSVVYKALYLVLNKIVAIKTMHSHLVTDSDALLRFKREAQAASQLDHPNVIKIYGFGITSGANVQPYIVMDYLEGAALSDVIKSHGFLPVPEALKIFIQVCNALNQAHNKGVIHRDLKPSNIMLVEKDGDPNFVKLVDFGIAKIVGTEGESAHRLTQTGDVFGSPLFMSPEQCMGRNVDKRSDVYSLGCVLYEALTGKAPHQGSNVFETFHKHISTIPEPLKIEGADRALLDRLDAVVFKALEKDPDKRYQSMADFESDLIAIQNDLSSGIRGTGLRGELAKKQRWFSRLLSTSPKHLVILSGVLIVIGLAGAFVWSKCSWFYQEHSFTTPATRWLSYKYPKILSKVDELERQATLDKGTEGIKIHKAAFGTDPVEMLNLWNKKADYCHRLDAPADELEARQEILTIYKRLGKPSTLEYATALEAFAYCCITLGSYHSAINPLEEAQKIRDHISMSTADNYFALGSVYANSRRISESMQQLSLALVRLDTRTGPRDTKMSAITRASIGDDFRALGRWKEADANYATAERELKDSQWKHKRIFLNELWMIRAYVNLKQNHYKEAASYYAKSMGFLEEQLKDKAEDLKRILDGYSYAAWQSGDFLRAIELHDRSARIGLNETKK
jgi:serine/threonine protein kinase